MYTIALLSIDHKRCALRKVLHIITGLNTGGAEMMLYKLCANKTDNVEYKIISLTNIGPIGDKITSLGIEVESLGLTKSLNSLFKFFLLIWMIKKFNPNVVQTWLYHADLIGGVAAFLSGKKVYWNIRQASVNKNLNKWHTVLASRICAFLSFIPHKILSCTQAGINEHVKIGYPQRKMIFVPNGFDMNQYPLGLHDKDIILHVGRYAPLKDHQTFIEVAKRIHEEKPEFEFHMYGDGVDNSTPLFQNLPPYIKALGRSDDLSKVYGEAKLLISTSLSEGFSNTIGEAMSCGTPVVATDVGDSKVIIDNKKLIAQPQDTLTIANRACNVLKSKINYTEIQEKISSRFNIQKIVKRYEELYASNEL
jgi:glycosyltransferase involved in cell wall biosynthesis